MSPSHGPPPAWIHTPRGISAQFPRTCQAWDGIQMWGRIQIPDPDRSPEAVPGDGEGRTPPRQDGMGGAGIPTTAPARRPRLGALGKRRLSQQRQECARAQAKVGAAGWGGTGGQEWGARGGGDPNTPPQDPPGGSVPPTHPEEAPDGRQVSGTRRPLRFWHLFPYLAPHPLLSPGGSHAGVPPSCPPALTQLIRTILGVPEPGSGTRHSPYMTLPTENFPASSSGPPAVRRGGVRGGAGELGGPPNTPRQRRSRYLRNPGA